MTGKFKNTINETNNEGGNKSNGNGIVDEVIRDIIKKQRNQCAICHIKINNQGNIHHIDWSGQSNTPNQSRENLILLCINCHNLVHGRVSKQYNAKKFIFSYWDKSIRDTEKFFYIKYLYELNKYIIANGSFPTSFRMKIDLELL